MLRIRSYEPRRELARWSHGMNRLFDEFVGQCNQAGEECSLGGSWAPAVNIRERVDGLEVRADLPGMDPKDVDLAVENGVLSIRGERSLEECAEGESYHRVECRYGTFDRSFNLPTSVDPEKIAARFVNGELIVTLPKREESKPRSLKIEVAN